MCCRNVQAMRKLLLDLWDDACPLFTVPGTVGEISKVDYFWQLVLEIRLQRFKSYAVYIHTFSGSWIWSVTVALMSQHGTLEETTTTCTCYGFQCCSLNSEINWVFVLLQKKTWIDGEWGDRWTDQFRPSLYLNWRHVLKVKPFSPPKPWLLHIEVDFFFISGTQSTLWDLKNQVAHRSAMEKF